jgi:hypothetical protein
MLYEALLDKRNDLVDDRNKLLAQAKREISFQRCQTLRSMGFQIR